MRPRRVLLCLPDQPSEEILEVARTVKAALSMTFQVRYLLDGETDDDELTPVDNPLYDVPIVLRISEDDNTR